MTATAAPPQIASDDINVAQVNKRKLSEVDVEQPKANGVASESTSPNDEQADAILTKVQTVLKDIATVLQRHDTNPSILEYPLDDEDTKSSDEPSAKRTRLSPDSKIPTIATNIETGKYASLESLTNDVDRVTSTLIKTVEDKDSTSKSGQGQLGSDDSALLLGVLAFKKVLKGFAQDPTVNAVFQNSNGALKKDELSSTNGIQVKTRQIDIDIFKSGQPVLSIFANAQGPKQLFSSFQKPAQIGETSNSSNVNAVVSVTLPLRETSLPNFVSVTKVPNIPLKGKSKPVGKSIGERFQISRSFPVLEVPKPVNKLVTKSSSVNWISHESLVKPRPRTVNWCLTKQATGKWLGYNSNNGDDPKSPEERRRQRDRALSTGAAQPPQSEATREAEDLAKEEALFRTAFSSFAPCIDNSNSTIPVSVRNEIWWERVGRHRAETVFVDPALPDEEDDSPPHADEEIDLKLVEEAIENFDNIDPALLGPNDPLDIAKAEKDKDVDDKLQEITDLLDTLYSYQRMRNSTLPSATTAIAPVAQKNSLSELVGTPAEPSTAELEVYNSLRARLAEIILELPPYALARINGDQLEELKISPHILVEVEDTPGHLEDDGPQPTPKPQPVPTPAPAQAVTPRPPSQSSYNNLPQSASQYSRSTAPAPVAGRHNSTYYPQQQTQAPRTPSISYPRTTGGVQTYAQGYTNSVPRPTFSQQYSQSPAARPGYNQAPLHQQVHQQLNRPPSYNGYYTPGATPQAGFPRQHYPSQPPPMTGYTPQRVQQPQPAPSYSYTQPAVGYSQPSPSPHIRTASPMQPAAASPSVQYNRPPSAQASRPSYYNTPQPTAIGPSGFHSTMSAHEQNAMMERQRAQAHMQHQARLQAMSPPGQYTPGMNIPGQAPVASAYTPPPRQLSHTPQPHAQPGQQTNGMSGPPHQ